MKFGFASVFFFFAFAFTFILFVDFFTEQSQGVIYKLGQSFEVSTPKHKYLHKRGTENL